MKCVICKKGNTIAGTTIVTLNRNGATFIVKNVPAQICQNCGEEYVDNETTSRLIKAAEDSARRGAIVDISEYRAA